MQSDNSAHLCRLDSQSLDGIVNILPLEDVRALTRTGDKRLRALLAVSLRRLHSIDKVDLSFSFLESGLAPFHNVTSVTVKGSSQRPWLNDRSLDATILPPRLTRLKAPSCMLSVDKIQPIDGAVRVPILPHLKVLQVSFFSHPLSVLSTALERVDIRSGFVDFEIDKPAQFNIRSLRVDYARLRELGILEQVLDRVSPSKMTIEKLDGGTYYAEDEYFPASVTDLRWRIDNWTKDDLLRASLKLPVGLTKLVIHHRSDSEFSDFFAGFRPSFSLLESLRQHLPNLSKLIRNEAEEVLLENGQCRSFLPMLEVMNGSYTIQHDDLSEFMIFDHVRQPRRFFAKYLSFSPRIEHIMKYFPALGLHMVRNLSLAEMSTVCSHASFPEGSRAVYLWIIQLEANMFSDKNELIVRWIVLLRRIGYHCAVMINDILKHLEPKLAPNLFRVMLHLVWIIAYNKPTTIDECGPYLVGEQQSDVVLKMLRCDYNYTGFMPSYDTRSFVVYSLRRVLLESSHLLDCDDVAFALELMEDESLADKACRGLIDNHWFDRYGTWRIMQVMKETLGDQFVLYRDEAQITGWHKNLSASGRKSFIAYIISDRAISKYYSPGKISLRAGHKRSDVFKAVSAALPKKEARNTAAQIICCPSDLP